MSDLDEYILKSSPSYKEHDDDDDKDLEDDIEPEDEGNLFEDDEDE